MRVRLGVSRPEWDAAIAALPPRARDVYFTEAYHALHGEGWLGLVEDGDARLLVPGLRTRVEGAAWDLQTANGYGGPIATSSDRGFLEAAWSAFRAEAAGAGCVAAFFRLHPLLGNEAALPSAAVIRDDRQTAVVDLAGGAEAVWARSGSRHRNMVRKGRRDGVVVEWCADLEEFARMYDDAMRRMDAPPRLRFTGGYFDALGRLPGTAVALAREGGRVAAGAVFLIGAAWAHYHLAARVPGTGNHLGNLVLQAGVERALAAGLEAVHLGGGRTAHPDDALLRFKRGVTTTERTFRVARVLVDAPAYEALVADWSRRAGAAPAWLLGYRQPVPGASA